MNEQIGKIYVEACIAAGNLDEREFCEKFAELIIRECANQATWAQDTNAKDIGGEVLKHFGVKE
jgi:hypothetical protein